MIIGGEKKGKIGMGRGKNRRQRYKITHIKLIILFPAHLVLLPIKSIISTSNGLRLSTKRGVEFSTGGNRIDYLQPRKGSREVTSCQLGGEAYTSQRNVENGASSMPRPRQRLREGKYRGNLQIQPQPTRSRVLFDVALRVCVVIVSILVNNLTSRCVTCSSTWREHPKRENV